MTRVVARTTAHAPTRGGARNVRRDVGHGVRAGGATTAAARVLQLQQAAGNASVARLLVPVQRGEGWDQVTGVGPLDTWQAKDDAQEALRHADSSGLPGFSDGPQDAYRHALWLCLMTRSIGADQAKQVGDTHEEQVTNPNADIQRMDHHNNAMGIYLARQAKQKSDCPGIVMDALRRGNLLIIRNWRDRDDAIRFKRKKPAPTGTVASNVVPGDLETGIRPLEAGHLDVHALNEKYRAERERELIEVLKRPVRRGDDAAAVAKHREVLARFRDFQGYWSGTYRDRIKQRADNDELVALLYSRVSRVTRRMVLDILEGRETKTEKKARRSGR